MREWIVTNGLGGYASLTLQNTNTRKYHGLLVSSLNPPTERWVLVSNVFDELIYNGKKQDLRNIKNNFSFDVFPTFSYEINGIKIKKTIFMEYGKDTTILRYRIDTNNPFSITHNPVLNSRHIYDVNKQRYLTFHHEFSNDTITIKPDNLDKTIQIILKDTEFQPLHYWEELFYEKDHERHDSWIDNNVHIGKICKNVDRFSDYYLVFSLEKKLNIDPVKIFINETGPEATPPVVPTLLSFGRSLEKEKPVPPPDLCMRAAFFKASKMPSMLSSTGRTKHAANCPSLLPAFISVGELGRNLNWVIMS